MSSKKDEIIVLKKALTPIHLWTIGVGIVISGNYFGWNFGLSQSGFRNAHCHIIYGDYVFNDDLRYF